MYLKMSSCYVHKSLINLLSCLSFSTQVMFPYQAESDFELSLSVGEYVVIREVSIQIKAYKIPFFSGSGHQITERILKLIFDL